MPIAEAITDIPLGASLETKDMIYDELGLCWVPNPPNNYSAYSKSLDSGLSWSAPKQIQSGASNMNDIIKLLTGAYAGRIIIQFGSSTIYSDDDGDSWSTPIGVGGWYGGLAQLVNDNVIVVYGDGNDDTYSKVSTDGGASWGSAVSIDSGGPMNGWPTPEPWVLTKNDPGDIIVFQKRGSLVTNKTMRYYRSVNNGSSWSGPYVMIDPAPDSGFIGTGHDIIQMDGGVYDGEWILVCSHFLWSVDTYWSAWAYRSAGGATDPVTWDDPIRINPDSDAISPVGDEIAQLRPTATHADEILFMGQPNSGTVIARYLSEDGGLSWGPKTDPGIRANINFGMNRFT